MRTRRPYLLASLLAAALVATSASSRLIFSAGESTVTNGAAKKMPVRAHLKPTPLECAGLQFHDANTNELYQPEMGLSLIGGFGAAHENGIVITPVCPAPALDREIVLPVLLIDWEDFDPRTDLSNENNPQSAFPEYVAQTPEALTAYLNGPTGPAQYYRDSSGGQVRFRFEVIGWLRSDAPGSYLKPRSAYVSYNTDVNQYQCDQTAIMLDAMRDAIVQKGVDFRSFDSDRQISGNPHGFIDGIGLIYEGHTGMCNGTNVSGVRFGPTTVLQADGLSYATGSSNMKDLVPSSDPNYPLFQSQDVLYDRYINMAEQYGDNAYSAMTTLTWAHEIGHLWLDFPDHYMDFHNFSYWVLSGHQGHQPAAWEKWLYGKWLLPTQLSQNGRYQLKANEIARGASYNNGTYLYQIPLQEGAHRYLTVENRWFRQDGNVEDLWTQDTHGPNSGVLVMEFDWSHQWVDNVNGLSQQLFRHAPSAEPVNAVYSSQRGFRAREVFIRCGDVECVKLSGFTAPGAEVSFDFMRYNRSADDQDHDGIADAQDAFPTNQNEWLDSDHDGVGDNADADVDNDGHNDDVDAFPADPAEWLDSDGDGQGNNADSDDDNDGVADAQDAFPVNAGETVDTDHDGIGNNADSDDDNDGVADSADALPLNAGESVDTDHDGVGNNADGDDDNDGVADSADAFPLDPTRQSAQPPSSPSAGGGGGGGTLGVSGLLFAGLLWRRRFRAMH